MSNCSSLQTIFQASLTENESSIFSSVSLSNVHRILKFLVGLAWENVVNMTSPMWRFYWSIKRVTIFANMDWSYVHSLRSELSLYVLLNPEVWQWMQQDENILFLTVSTEFKCLLHLPDLICFSVCLSLCWKRRFDFAILGQIRYATVLNRDYWGTKKMKFLYTYIYIYWIVNRNTLYTDSFGISWKKGHKVSVACTTLTTIKWNLSTFASKRNFYSNNKKYLQSLNLRTD